MGLAGGLATNGILGGGSTSQRCLQFGSGAIAGATTAATFVFCYYAGMVAVAGASSAEAAFYFDPADYPAGATLRLRGMEVQNAVAQATCNFTYGLFPVATTGGASGAYGTIASVSAATMTAAINTPGATSTNQAVSSQTAMPSAGWFALGVTLSATTTTNANSLHSARLDIFY